MPSPTPIIHHHPIRPPTSPKLLVPPTLLRLDHPTFAGDASCALSRLGGLHYPCPGEDLSL